MTENIRNIFEHNIKLIGDIDKSVFYFRQQECDKALSYMVYSMDDIKFVIEEVISDQEYFHLVDKESMLEMLTGMIEAKKNQDFVLLADLLELQLINFLIGIQELIISKEEILFDEENYKDNIRLLLEKGEGFTDEIREPINTVRLLESGYRVEFTSCGRMTLAAENQGSKFYFHSNSRVQAEAFHLARNWYQKDVKRYILYGFGMGYHIRELLEAAPDAELEVYEADRNVIQLACAFADVKDILLNRRMKLVFDPNLVRLTMRLSARMKEEAYIVHYPSCKNYRDDSKKAVLKTALPWTRKIEAC